MIAPVPLPPPPYVAPDLHPIAARGSALLVIARERGSRRVLDRELQHDLWLASEGAPLEVRFHREDDGSTWAEQAAYAGGDRRGGVASASAGAFVSRLDGAASGASFGSLRGFVRFVIRDAAGRVLRRWRTDVCAGAGVVRLDRPDSPVLPTFPSSWGACRGDTAEGGAAGAYVRGRLVALDRGWAMRVPTEVGDAVRPLRPGTYTLDVTVNPDGAVADIDRANDAARVRLRVKDVLRTVDRSGLDLPPGCEVREGGRIFCSGSNTGVTVGEIEAVASARARSLLMGQGRVARPAGSGPVLSTRVRPAGRDATGGRQMGAHAHVREHEHDGAAAAGAAFGLGLELRRLEEFAARDAARAEGGHRPRVGERAPAPPEGVDLPNLRNAPGYDIAIDEGVIGRRKGRTLRRDLLTFGSLTYNTGPGKLEVEAFRESGTTLGAYQVFFRDGERVTRQARGTLIWHAAPGHNHFHFQSFARYQLVTMDGRVARDSGKRSWCIVDTDDVDSTLPGVPSAATAAQQDGGGACGSDPGSLWARLGLSVGAGDFYSQEVAGQAFDVTTLRNGAYRIVITANPDGLIAETSLADNVSQRTVVLGGRRGARTVRVLPHPLIDERAEEPSGVGEERAEKS